MYMDTTAPNTIVNTHTFFLPLKISYTRTFTREQTEIKPPKRTNVGPESSEHTHRHIVECMLVGLWLKTLSYGLCCFKVQWFKMIPKPLHPASLFVPENLLGGQTRCLKLKGQKTMNIKSTISLGSG